MTLFGLILLAGATQTPLDLFLKNTIQLAEAPTAALARGEVVTKQMPTAEKADVAVFGGVRVTTTADAFTAKARDVVAFRRSPSTIEIGAFSSTPAVADLAGLTLDDADFEAAKACQPGGCDLKLAKSAIDRLHAEINWQAPDARKKATAVLHQMLVDYVTDYKRRGAAHLPTFRDKDKPVDGPTELRLLLDNSKYLIDYVPEFYDYVVSFPQKQLAGIEDIFYWVKDKNWPKPTISVYHVSLWRSPKGTVFVTQKQIYATHFVRTGLSVTALVAPQDGGTQSTLMELYRARIDPPGGIVGSALMGKIRGSVETGMKASLALAKSRLH